MHEAKCRDIRFPIWKTANRSHWKRRSITERGGLRRRVRTEPFVFSTRPPFATKTSFLRFQCLPAYGTIVPDRFPTTRLRTVRTAPHHGAITILPGFVRILATLRTATFGTPVLPRVKNPAIPATWRPIFDGISSFPFLRTSRAGIPFRFRVPIRSERILQTANFRHRSCFLVTDEFCLLRELPVLEAVRTERTFLTETGQIRPATFFRTTFPVLSDQTPLELRWRVVHEKRLRQGRREIFPFPASRTEPIVHRFQLRRLITPVQSPKTDRLPLPERTIRYREAVPSTFPA